ncbi:MAG: TRAP transporter small permease subunit [Hyphomicrobiaceae bacterium]
MTGDVERSEGIISRLYACLRVISKAINAVGTLVVLGLVLLVSFDVVARGAFNMPFRGTVELVQFSMVLIVFLQLPDVVRADRLTRSDGLLTILGRKNPALSWQFRRAIDVVSAVLMTLVAITMWPEVVDAWETDDFFGTPGIFTAPWWPVKLVIFSSAVLCALIWSCKALLLQNAIDHDPTAIE